MELLWTTWGLWGHFGVHLDFSGTMLRLGHISYILLWGNREHFGHVVELRTIILSYLNHVGPMAGGGRLGMPY